MCRGNDDGNGIVAELRRRYYDIAHDCTADEKVLPLYHCAGWIMRAVSDAQPTDNPWSFKEINLKPERQSFSTAFLHMNSTFSEIAKGYETGFIFYPPSSKKITLLNLEKPEVLCAFPHNAGTDHRNQYRGCTHYKYDTTGSSGWCHEQGIVNIDKWIEHYTQIKEKTKDDLRYLGYYQCAFAMWAPNSHHAFQVLLAARAHIQKDKELAMKNNELFLQTWTNSEMAPVEAIFFLRNIPRGLRNAYVLQDRFKEVTKRYIPVVGFFLPETPNFDLKIEYFSRG